MTTHKSDCATHNAPAMEPGPCGTDEQLIAEIKALYFEGNVPPRARGHVRFLLSLIAARDAEIERLRGHVCATPHCAECKAKEDANRRRLEAKP